LKVTLGILAAVLVVLFAGSGVVLGWAIFAKAVFITLIARVLISATVWFFYNYHIHAMASVDLAFAYHNVKLGNAERIPEGVANKFIIVDGNNPGGRAITVADIDKEVAKFKAELALGKKGYRWQLFISRLEEIAPLEMSGFKFVKNRMLIVMLSAIIVPAFMLKFMPGMGIESFLPEGWLQNFFIDYHLPYTWSELLHTAFLVYGFRYLDIMKTAMRVWSTMLNRKFPHMPVDISSAYDLYKERHDNEKVVEYLKFAIERGLLSSRGRRNLRTMLSEEMKANGVVFAEAGKVKKLGWWLVSRPLAMVLAAFVFIPLVPVFGILSIYVLIMKQFGKNVNPQIAFAAQEGKNFWNSFVYMSTISAEINAVISSADWLAAHPILKPVGFIAQKFAHSLEGKDGIISLGQYANSAFTGITGVDLTNVAYGLMGGEGRFAPEQAAAQNGMSEKTAEKMVSNAEEIHQLQYEKANLERVKESRDGNKAKNWREAIGNLWNGLWADKSYDKMSSADISKRLSEINSRLEDLARDNAGLKLIAEIEALEKRLAGKSIQLKNAVKQQVLAELGYYRQGVNTNEDAMKKELEGAVATFVKLNDKTLQVMSEKDKVERLMLTQYLELKKNEQFVAEVEKAGKITPEFIQELIAEAKRPGAYAAVAYIMNSQSRAGFTIQAEEGKFVCVPLEGEPETLLTKDLPREVVDGLKRKLPVSQNVPLVYLSLGSTGDPLLVETLRIEAKLKEYLAARKIHTGDRKLLLPSRRVFNNNEVQAYVNHGIEFVRNNIGDLEAKGLNKELIEKIIKGEKVTWDELTDTQKEAFKTLGYQLSGRVTLSELESAIKSAYVEKAAADKREDISGRLNKFSSRSINELLNNQAEKDALEEVLKNLGLVNGDLSLNKDILKKLIKGLADGDFTKFIAEVKRQYASQNEIDSVVKGLINDRMRSLSESLENKDAKDLLQRALKILGEKANLNQELLENLMKRFGADNFNAFINALIARVNAKKQFVVLNNRIVSGSDQKESEGFNLWGWIKDLFHGYIGKKKAVAGELTNLRRSLKVLEILNSNNLNRIDWDNFRVGKINQGQPQSIL
jgi:hypothetical protein